MTKKRNTERIESKKELILSILKSAPYGIVTLKSIRNIEKRIIDFEFIMVNKRFEDLMGGSLQKLIGKRFFEVFDRDQWEREFNLFLNHSMKGDYFVAEKEMNVEDKFRFFLISGIHFDEALTLHFIDITEYQKSIHSIREKENKYRALFEESIDPIFVLNESYVIVDFNRPFSDEFGFKEKDRGRKDLSDLIKEPKTVKAFRTLLKKKKKLSQMELILPDQSGDPRDCIVHCAPLLQQIGDENIYIGVIRDITERKKAEKEMIFAEKMATTGKLARIIAHELRNPLTNISLALTELEEEIAPISKEAQYYFNMIRRNAERIQTLTRDFLNSSKSKSMYFEKRNINSIVSETLTFIRDRMDLKEMTLKENLGTDLPLLDIDPDQMKVGLLNLFLNAVEAMEPGRGVLEISTSLQDRTVAVVICDNGQGIKQDDIGSIFDPFYSGKNEGTGLGLTVTKNIIAGHKGNIFVESKVGEGTRFTIAIPLSN
jgi:two-component system, sporulation sensor kinase E